MSYEDDQELIVDQEREIVKLKALVRDLAFRAEQVCARAMALRGTNNDTVPKNLIVRLRQSMKEATAWLNRADEE